MRNTTSLVWKVLMVIEKRFRNMNALHLLGVVYNGVKFVDGNEETRETDENSPLNQKISTPLDKSSI